MILVIDGNELLMKSIFIWRKSKKVPITYFLLLQLFKYIKIFKPDQVYLAADGGNSWRKTIYPKYKANRKENRNKYEDIPWEKVFKDYDRLLGHIQSFTPIIVAKIPNIEGDDIMSYVCRNNTDETVIIASQDKDIQQLTVLPNTLVYSTRKSKLVEKDKLENVIDEKVNKGDASDNIPKATSFLDKVRNTVLVDLIHLPVIIDEAIRKHIESISKNVENGTFLKIYQFKFLGKVYNLLHEGEKNE